MKKWSMRKKYVTRMGEPVRVLCVDGPDPAGPIIGLLPGRKGVTQWDKNGKTHGPWDHSFIASSDLIPLVVYKSATRFGLMKHKGKIFSVPILPGERF